MLYLLLYWNVFTVYSQWVRCLHQSYKRSLILVLFTLTYRKRPTNDSTKRFRQHTKLLFFRKQRNNYNSLLLCILCKLFLLLSNVSIEPKKKESWTLQNSILYLCFSKVAPFMGGKHFRQTAGSCKGVIVWLNYILHIQADLALPLAHSHIVFVICCSILNFHFTNFQIAFFSPTTLHSFLMYL